MNILVYNITSDNENYDNQRDMVKSKNIIICPKCGEKAKIDFKNYKISLTCKNNDITNDILFKEFEKTQYKDESKIICGNCKTKTKSEEVDNIFYRCILCKLNLCPLCKTTHEKEHIIINYEQMEFICNTHNQAYTSFCNKCKIDLCEKCEKEHQDHDKIAFGKMMVEKEKLKERMKSLKNEITKLDINIREMIKILNQINNNMNSYYNFIEKTIYNFDDKNKNMENIQNINKIYENIEKVIKDIKKGVTEYTFNNSIKFKNLMEIYNKMNIKEDYFIYKNNPDKDIKIFGDTFLTNNKNFKETCKIECWGKEFNLKDYYSFSEFKDKETLEIKIKGIENLTNLSFMFFGTPLMYLPNNSSA